MKTAGITVHSLTSIVFQFLKGNIHILSMPNRFLFVLDSIIFHEKRVFCRVAAPRLTSHDGVKNGSLESGCHKTRKCCLCPGNSSPNDESEDFPTVRNGSTELEIKQPQPCETTGLV